MQAVVAHARANPGGCVVLALQCSAGRHRSAYLAGVLQRAIWAHNVDGQGCDVRAFWPSIACDRGGTRRAEADGVDVARSSNESVRRILNFKCTINLIHEAACCTVIIRHNQTSHHDHHTTRLQTGVRKVYKQVHVVLICRSSRSLFFFCVVASSECHRKRPSEASSCTAFFFSEM